MHGTRVDMLCRSLLGERASQDASINNRLHCVMESKKGDWGDFPQSPLAQLPANSRIQIALAAPPSF